MGRGNRALLWGTVRQSRQWSWHSQTAIMEPSSDRRSRKMLIGRTCIPWSTLAGSLAALTLQATVPAEARPTACSERAGKWYCRVAGQANCKKGGITQALGLPTSPPPWPLVNPPTEEGLPFPPPAGFRYIPGTQRAVITESHKDGRVHVSDVTEKSLVCTWYCKSSLRHDAFVYGYCEVEARKVR